MAGIPTLDWFAFDESARFQRTPLNSNISSAEYEQRRYSEHVVESAKRETPFTSGAVQQQQVMYNPPLEVQGSVLLNNEGHLLFRKWFDRECRYGTQMFRYKHYSLDKLVNYGNRPRFGPLRDKENPRAGKLYTAQFIGFPQISAHGATWSIRFALRLFDNLEPGY